MEDVGLSSTMRYMHSVTNILNKLRGPIQSVPTSADVVIRYARPDEADALASLARLDASRAPQGDVIVADVQGELWAAVSLDDGHRVGQAARLAGRAAILLVRPSTTRGPPGGLVLGAFGVRSQVRTGGTPPGRRESAARRRP
jgi:hypothetical protein